MNQQSLKDAVTAQVDVRWADFAETHPHLAAAVERSVLIDAVVTRITEDPAYEQATQAAVVDTATSAAGASLIDLIDRWVRRFLSI